METVRYCTPEWLDECSRRYILNPHFEEDLKKVSVTVAFRVKAEPGWGIEEDILFGADVKQGRLIYIKFFTPEQARQEMEFVLAATPQEWKKILRKENKFLTDFMLGKITLAQGSKVGVLAVAPHANTLVEVLTQARLVFPDEMTQEELAEYRVHQKEFRSQLGV
jgi:putative sterol carrier protein